MSNEEQEKITIDQPMKIKKDARTPWRVIGVLFFILVIIAFFGLMTMAYYRFTLMDQQINQLTSYTQNKMQQVDLHLTALQKKSSEAQQAVQDLIKEYNNLKQLVSDLAPAASKDQWIIAKARYYVNIAYANLQFENAITPAIELLKLADSMLRNVPNPKLEEIRKALAIDIADLQSVPSVDISGIYMQLSALNGKIDQLPLVNKPMNSAEKSTHAQNEKNPSWWSRGLQTTWQGLRQIVVVRYNQTGKIPLIPPDQQGFLYLNLHAVILNSMWALLHGQTDIYRTSLAQASAWIKEYCVTDVAITQAMLNDLTQLQKIDIHPTVPKMTNSLQAFEAIKENSF